MEKTSYTEMKKSVLNVELIIMQQQWQVERGWEKIITTKSIAIGHIRHTKSEKRKESALGVAREKQIMD